MRYTNISTPHLALLAIIALCIGSATFGATWTVEKDGSGDFTVIQDAVDASASGDTIVIGPGRFDDFSNVHWGTWTLAAVEDKGLTFVGAGAGQTILGPENYGDIDDSAVVCISVRAEGETTRVSNLTFENVQLRCITIGMSGRLEVDDCVFQFAGGGIAGVLGDGGWIRNSEFSDINTHLTAEAICLNAPSVEVLVENCRFDHCQGAVGSYWGGCTGIVVRQCEIIDGFIGVLFASGASGHVEDCTLTRLTQYGCTVSGGGAVVVENNEFDLTGTIGWCYGMGYGSHEVHNNVFKGSTVLIGLFCPSCDLDISNNLFLRTGPEAWYIRPSTSPYLPSEVVPVDFTNNSWGTEDPDEVAAWIYDYADDENYRYTVDFLPMSGVVATEPRNWSSIKSLFGDG